MYSKCLCPLGEGVHSHRCWKKPWTFLLLLAGQSSATVSEHRH